MIETINTQREAANDNNILEQILDESRHWDREINKHFDQLNTSKFNFENHPYLKARVLKLIINNLIEDNRSIKDKENFIKKVLKDFGDFFLQLDEFTLKKRDILGKKYSVWPDKEWPLFISLETSLVTAIVLRKPDEIIKLKKEWSDKLSSIYTANKKLLKK